MSSSDAGGAGRGRVSLTLSDLQEWCIAMGLEIEAEGERNFVNQLRDGVLLCQLVNKIRSGSVDVVRSDPNYVYDGVYKLAVRVTSKFVCVVSLTPHLLQALTCSCCEAKTSYNHVSTTASLCCL